MTKRVDVEFKSEGTTVRGWLYLANDSKRSPTVVLAGGWCYVREIVMPTYAQAFADAGINALIFDYRNLGVSDGDNRQHLDPWAQVRGTRTSIRIASASGASPIRAAMPSSSRPSTRA